MTPLVQVIVLFLVGLDAGFSLWLWGQRVRLRHRQQLARDLARLHDAFSTTYVYPSGTAWAATR